MEEAAKTVAEIIEVAIQREMEAFFFYDDLIAQVEDPQVKETLQWVAEEEKKHRRFLVDYRDGRFGDAALRMTAPVDYKLAEHMAEPESEGELSRENVFLVAAHREKRSHQFYTELARLHPDENVQGILQRMASEELLHKEKMEYLYTNTAFPQTAGG